MMSARSKKSIIIDDREVEILFTNRTLANVESRLGKTVVALAQGFADGDVGLMDVATLLQAGMEEARRDARVGGAAINLNDAFGVLDEVGFGTAAAAVIEALAEVIAFDRDSEKN